LGIAGFESIEVQIGCVEMDKGWKEITSDDVGKGGSILILVEDGLTV